MLVCSGPCPILHGRFGRTDSVSWISVCAGGNPVDAMSGLSVNSFIWCPTHMKLFSEFWPILLFFLVYNQAGIYTATAVLIVAISVQVGYGWLKNRRLEPMQGVTLVLVVLFGGATLFLRDPRFIQLKPTVLQWLMAIIFAGSHLIGDRVIVQRLLASKLTLPAPIWSRLNVSWVFFFFLSGGLNLYVANNYDEATWVQFKLFGLMGLTFLFVLGQGLFLARYIKSDSEETD